MLLCKQQILIFILSKGEYMTSFGSKKMYTNGAHLRSMQLENGRWIWSVESFEDDSFMDGVEVSPVEDADSEEGLLKQDYEGE